MEKLAAHYIQIGLSIAVILFFIVLKWGINRSVRSYARRQEHEIARISYVLKLMSIGMTMLGMWVLALVWEISIQGLSVYFASIFTIVGVAFFASWSILSNVTAAMILFFYFPFKIGSKIKVMDGDNSITGVIKDITLFTMVIQTEENTKVMIPNNVMITKTNVLLD